MSKPFEPYTSEKNDEVVTVGDVTTYPMRTEEFEDNIVFYYTLINFLDVPYLILGIIRNGNLKQMLTPSDADVYSINLKIVLTGNPFNNLDDTYQKIENYLKENKEDILNGDDENSQLIDVEENYSSLLDELNSYNGDDENVETHLNEMIEKGIQKNGKNRRLYLFEGNSDFFDGETHIYLGSADLEVDERIENIYKNIYQKIYAGTTVGEQAETDETTRIVLEALVKEGKIPQEVLDFVVGKFGGKKTTKKRKSKRNKKSKRKTKKSKRKTKKMHGGVAFNDPVDINNKSYNLPPLNSYENDPQNTLTDSRLLPEPSLFGGKKRKTARRRKMKGGSLIGTDMITGLNTTMTNEALAFGTTGGTEFMAKTLNTEPISSGDAIVPKDTMVPLV